MHGSPLINVVFVPLVFGLLCVHAEAGSGEPDGYGFTQVAKSDATSEDETKRYSLRFLYGVATDNSLGDLAQGQVDVLQETRVYGLELGRVFAEDFLELPIDLSANLGMMYHLADGDPSGVFQFNLYMKVEWTEFWWSDSLRTRIGLGEGLSVVDQVTYSEELRRDGKGSRKLLNYLDFSLSLNAADLGTVTGLKGLFGYQADWLEDTWVVANISHRSGVYGVFGKSTSATGERSIIAGGDNILTLGIIRRF